MFIASKSWTIIEQILAHVYNAMDQVKLRKLVKNLSQLSVLKII